MTRENTINYVNFCHEGLKEKNL